MIVIKSEIREEASAKCAIFVWEIQLYNASKPLILAPKFPKSSYPGIWYPPPTPSPFMSKNIITYNSPSWSLEPQSYTFLGTIQFQEEKNIICKWPPK